MELQKNNITIDAVSDLIKGYAKKGVETSSSYALVNSEGGLSRPANIYISGDCVYFRSRPNIIFPWCTPRSKAR